MLAAWGTAAAQTMPRLETEIVFFTNNGPVPAVIKRTKGPFYLKIVDQITVSGHSLSMAPDAGSPPLPNPSGSIDTISLGNKHSSTTRLDLPTGDFLIQSSVGSQSVCRISIH